MTPGNRDQRTAPALQDRYAAEPRCTHTFMLSRRFPLLTALAAGLIAGVAYPFVDVALACRVPISEACVWGKAYFPLTLGLSVVVLGGAVTGLLYAALTWRRRSQSHDDDA